MLKLKSANGLVNDFDDDIKQLLKYVNDEGYRCEQKLKTIAEINRMFNGWKEQGILDVSLEENINSDPTLVQSIKDVLGENSWVLNPRTI